MNAPATSATPRPRPPYAYRADPAVPPFPDERPVVVYDGVCALCAGWTRFLASRDPEIRFLAAQSDAGAALLAHFGYDPVAFDSLLWLEDGVGHGKLAAAARALLRLGPGWRALGRLMRAPPRPLADWLYDRVAANRYRLFGRADRCLAPDPAIRGRFIATGPTPRPLDAPPDDPDAPTALSGGTRRAARHAATSGTDRSA